MLVKEFPKVTTEPNSAHSLPLVAELQHPSIYVARSSSGARTSVRKF
jgi:hypothetical protein